MFSNASKPSVETHTDNAEKKRKRDDINSTKNKEQDQRQFVGSMLSLIMGVKAGVFYPKKSKDVESQKDEIQEALEKFLTNIKSKELVAKTMQELTQRRFRQQDWEKMFRKNSIEALKKEQTDVSQRILRVIMNDQSNRFEKVKDLFHLVNLIMKLKEQQQFEVSSSELIDVLIQNNYCHIEWLMNGIRAILACHELEPNVDSMETLKDILNDYIDVWTFYLQTDQKKNSHYKKMMPEQKLDELRATIVNVLYPNQDQTQREVLKTLIQQEEFKLRKRRIKRTTVKVRNSMAFEVHRVTIGLHLTKHLMRNFVTDRSKTDRQHILAKVESCPYHFHVKFVSDIPRQQFQDKVRPTEIIYDQIVRNGDVVSDFEERIHYEEGSELFESSGNFWVMKTMEIPFRFTSCNCSIRIDDSHDNREEVQYLFDLTNTGIYQEVDLPNFRIYERNNMKKKIKPIKKDVFDTKEGYLDGNYYSYEIHSTLKEGKLPIRIILQGRPMSKIIDPQLDIEIAQKPETLIK